MKLSEFKIALNRKIQGDKKPPSTNEELNELIKEGIRYIALRTVPIDLLGSDINTQVPIRFVQGLRFIREPNDSLLDDDKIDIDEQLVDALILYVISDITGEKNYRLLKLREVQIEIDIYEHNIQTVLDDLEELNE